MPWVNPFLFGTSSQAGVEAIVEFANFSVTGAANGPFYVANATITQDPEGYFSGVDNTGNARGAIWTQFGTYEFTLLQNYSSVTQTSSGTSTVKLVDGRVTGDTLTAVENDIFTMYTNTVANTPTATQVSISDTSSFADYLAIELDRQLGTSVTVSGTCSIGITKVS